MADAKRDRLKRVPLFSRLGKRELGRVAQLADEIDVLDGRALTAEGEHGDEFFLVLDGQIKIERDGRAVATLGPGDFFGEIALVDGQPRTATARADGHAHLLVVGHRDFHSLMEEMPSVQLGILQALAARVRQVDPEEAGSPD
jgi:CRP/FNR family transcriptional regulator, cyclic AMP receptor protein